MELKSDKLLHTGHHNKLSPLRFFFFFFFFKKIIIIIIYLKSNTI
jgi:hypothetical protein